MYSEDLSGHAVGELKVARLSFASRVSPYTPLLTGTPVDMLAGRAAQTTKPEGDLFCTVSATGYAKYAAELLRRTELERRTHGMHELQSMSGGGGRSLRVRSEEQEVHPFCGGTKESVPFTGLDPNKGPQGFGRKQTPVSSRTVENKRLPHIYRVP